MEPKIQIKSVYKKFGKLEVLKDINLSVASGETVCIIGPSGSGKSTLLRCINGLEKIQRGDILIDGKTVINRKDNLKKCNIAMVFQQFNLFENLSVLDNITLAPICQKKKTKKEAVSRALELLEQVGLEDKVSNFPSQLSGGQKQRVAIARALAIEPDILLFDEPTSALDPEMVKEVLDTIKNLTGHGKTMLIVTHEMGFAQRAADRIVFMDEGQIVEINESSRFFAASEKQRTKEFIENVTRWMEVIDSKEDVSIQ